MYYILYIVMWDINMTTFDKGSKHCLVYGEYNFSGITPPYGVQWVKALKVIARTGQTDATECFTTPHLRVLTSN